MNSTGSLTPAQLIVIVYSTLKLRVTFRVMKLPLIGIPESGGGKMYDIYLSTIICAQLTCGGLHCNVIASGILNASSCRPVVSKPVGGRGTIKR